MDSMQQQNNQQMELYMEKFNAEWKKQMIENENTASQLT